MTYSSLKRTGFKQKSRKRMKQKSAKARKDDRTFSQRRSQWDGCSYPACTQPGAEGHHGMARSTRPDRRGDPDIRVPLCSEHHRWVEENPPEAERLGLRSTEKYELANSHPMAKVIRQLNQE